MARLLSLILLIVSSCHLTRVYSHQSPMRRNFQFQCKKGSTTTTTTTTPFFDSAVGTIIKKSPPIHLVVASETILLLSNVLRTNSTRVIAWINVFIHQYWNKKFVYYDAKTKNLITRFKLTEKERSEITSIKKAFNRHFTFSEDKNDQQAYPYTYITSAFTHKTHGHLSSNLICLARNGVPVENILGRRNYVYFYIASCYMKMILPPLIQNPDKTVLFFLKKKTHTSGNSHLLCALQTYYTLRAPHAQFEFDLLTKFMSGHDGISYRLTTLFEITLDVLCLAALGLISMHRKNPKFIDENIAYDNHILGYIFGTLTYLVCHKLYPYLIEPAVKRITSYISKKVRIIRRKGSRSSVKINKISTNVEDKKKNTTNKEV